MNNLYKKLKETTLNYYIIYHAVAQYETATNIYKNTGMTFSRVCKILSLYEKGGYVYKTRNGKFMIYKYTEKGLILYKAINEFFNKVIA